MYIILDIMPFFVEENIKKERIQTCLNCDRVIKTKRPDRINGILDWWFGLKCKKCGCGIRPKSMLELSKCPLNRWKR